MSYTGDEGSQGDLAISRNFPIYNIWRECGLAAAVTATRKCYREREATRSDMLRQLRAATAI